MESAETKFGAEQPAPRRGRPNLPSYRLTVVDSADAAGNMRRVTFALPEEAAAFDYKPGQALVMMIPTGDGEFGRRDYTIRSFDHQARTIAVDFLKHGDTPGPRWAIGARPGDEVEAKGPRGHTFLNPEADWHLFTGDETCIPAIAHILEEAPAGTKAFAFMEVQNKSGEVEFKTNADLELTWLHRGELPAGPSDLMANVVAAFALPQGRGQAYIIGETSNVRRQRHDLIARGMTREQIRSEGYWRPGRIGGHDHVDD
ncbi:siderophore-interacting protein [Chelativorans composti]|jgi:Siderophore-interacting protein|uniref:Siderophore-interacting protein n=1 Tax=Chelativorans composti TaxID=768533 RepID=A0ABW5DCQ8_9HYPH